MNEEHAKKVLAEFESKLDPNTSIFLTGKNREAFIKKLACMIDVEPEYNQVVGDNFWQLLSK